MRKIYAVVFALMVLLSVIMSLAASITSSANTGHTIRFVQDMSPTLTAGPLTDVNQQVTITFIMKSKSDSAVSL